MTVVTATTKKISKRANAWTSRTCPCDAAGKLLGPMFVILPLPF
jgi:hypothetical protein